MVARFEPLAAQWQAQHGLALGVGIGMCSGEAIIGNVGSSHYASYTIIGDPVNTAARLMQLAAAGEVLLSGPLYQRIRHLVPADQVKERGDVTLRGKSEAIPVYAFTERAKAHA